MAPHAVELRFDEIVTQSLGFACSLNSEIVDSHQVVKAEIRQIHLSLIDDEDNMKKLAVLVGLSGALLSARADIIRTFDNSLADDYSDDLGDYGAFAYPEKGAKAVTAKTVAAPAGFGSGNVFQLDFKLSGAYDAAGVGFAAPGWDSLDASAMTGIKVSLRTVGIDTVTVSLKSSFDADYDALASYGLSFDAKIPGTLAGVTTTILPTKFVFPSWWKSAVDPENPDDAGKLAAQTWVGSTSISDLNAKRTDVLKHLSSVQIAVGCNAKATCAIQGSVFIDSLIILGANYNDKPWHDEITTVGVVRSHGMKTQALRATIDGSMLNVVKPEASSASLELVRLDGSKIASWAISGSKASVSLPAGLEKGTYYAVVNSEGKRSSTSVSIVR